MMLNNIDAIRVGLIQFIEFKKMVVDVLHIVLRITDKLFELLLFRLEELDQRDNTKLLLIFKNLLEAHITSPFYKKENKFKLRVLNQNERFKNVTKSPGDI